MMISLEFSHIWVMTWVESGFVEPVRTPSQEEGLRVLRRCYREHIIINQARGTSIDVRRLKTRGYIIQCSMTLKKSVICTNYHEES